MSDTNVKQLYDNPENVGEQIRGSRLRIVGNAEANVYSMARNCGIPDVKPEAPIDLTTYLYTEPVPSPVVPEALTDQQEDTRKYYEEQAKRFAQSTQEITHATKAA